MSSDKASAIIVLSRRLITLIVLIVCVGLYLSTRHIYLPSEIKLTGYQNTWKYILRINRYTGNSCLFDGGTQQVDDELLYEYIESPECGDIEWFKLNY